MRVTVLARRLTVVYVPASPHRAGPLARLAGRHDLRRADEHRTADDLQHERHERASRADSHVNKHPPDAVHNTNPAQPTAPVT